MLVLERVVFCSLSNEETMKSFPCLFLIFSISKVGLSLSLLILLAGIILTITVIFSPTSADISGGVSYLLYCLRIFSAGLPISIAPLSSNNINSNSQVPSVAVMQILYLVFRQRYKL